MLLRNYYRQQMFLKTISFTYLPLYTVAINSMMEPLLRNANEHLDGLLPVLALSLHVYGS